MKAQFLRMFFDVVKLKAESLSQDVIPRIFRPWANSQSEACGAANGGQWRNFTCDLCRAGNICMIIWPTPDSFSSFSKNAVIVRQFAPRSNILPKRPSPPHIEMDNGLRKCIHLFVLGLVHFFSASKNKLSHSSTSSTAISLFSLPLTSANTLAGASNCSAYSN